MRPCASIKITVCCGPPAKPPPPPPNVTPADAVAPTSMPAMPSIAVNSRLEGLLIVTRRLSQPFPAVQSLGPLPGRFVFVQMPSIWLLSELLQSSFTVTPSSKPL